MHLRRPIPCCERGEFHRRACRRFLHGVVVELRCRPFALHTTMHHHNHATVQLKQARIRSCSLERNGPAHLLVEVAKNSKKRIDQNFFSQLSSHCKGSVLARSAESHDRHALALCFASTSRHAQLEQEQRIHRPLHPTGKKTTSHRRTPSPLDSLCLPLCYRQCMSQPPSF